MRKKIVAGNWKMNKTIDEGKNLINSIVELLKKDNAFNTKDYLFAILSPPFILLKESAVLTANLNKVSIAAQNCYTEDKGAFTGEISAEMIMSTGAKFVIIGHSERRAYFKEDSQMLTKKVNIALKYDISPIFCCGESAKERELSNHFKIVKQQIDEALFSLDSQNIKKITIAYEPVWAIGTGVNATPAQAQEMHAYIRGLLKEKYNNEIADEITILYGGSCNASNAIELFALPDVDGGLIGGASLKADEFVKIIDSVK